MDLNIEAACSHSVCGLPLSLTDFRLAGLNTHARTHFNVAPADPTFVSVSVLASRASTPKSGFCVCVCGCVHVSASREGAGEVGQTGQRSGATRVQEVSLVRISIIDKQAAVGKGDEGLGGGRDGASENRWEKGVRSEDKGQGSWRVRQKIQERKDSSQGHLLLKNQLTETEKRYSFGHSELDM